jgi:serine/threonine protein kinase/formylglycine-generating enzyme required for sulfatase activity
MSDFIGKSLGRYQIVEQLGIGGMATVYKAYDTRLERDVAVKVIRRQSFAEDVMERMLKRFEREAKSLAKLTHPNIVNVHDYGDYEGSPYLVMQYLPGDTLKAKTGKQMEYQDAARLLTPIARALEYAHKRDIIHRDIKPSNILLTEEEQPMLADFGIAKILASEGVTTLTGTGVGMGTPVYMAPEQWTGETVPQTDIYALGVVFFELLTGTRPFDAETPAGVYKKLLTEPLPFPSDFVPDLPGAVEKVLFKALAKRPEDRYMDMGAFVKALERLVLDISRHKDVTLYDRDDVPTIIKETEIDIPPSPLDAAETEIDTSPPSFYLDDMPEREVATEIDAAPSPLDPGHVPVHAAETEVDSEPSPLDPGHVAVHAAETEDDIPSTHYKETSAIRQEVMPGTSGEINSYDAQREDAAYSSMVGAQPAAPSQEKRRVPLWVRLLVGAGVVLIGICVINFLGDIISPQPAVEAPAAKEPVESIAEEAEVVFEEEVAEEPTEVLQIEEVDLGIVPDLIGMDIDQAREVIEEAGFVMIETEIWIETYSTSDADDSYNVIEQQPDAETELATGSEVEVEVVIYVVAEPSIGDMQISPKDGMLLVYVPAGEFLMGSTDEDIDEAMAVCDGCDRSLFYDEYPQHTVYLDAYWIDQTEVTNQMYSDFLNVMGNQSEGGVTWLDAWAQSVQISSGQGGWVVYGEKGELPAIEVSWYGAAAYCEWVGRRLPTEAEWEKAARGTDGRTYPWGEGIDCEHVQMHGCEGRTIPVGSLPDGASPYGALDMAGNVWEWVADWYEVDYYADSPSNNPLGPPSGSSRVIRGGSQFNTERLVRSAARWKVNHDDSNYDIGFRCALSDKH